MTYRLLTNLIGLCPKKLCLKLVI